MLLCSTMRSEMRKKKAFLSMLVDLGYHDMEGHTIAPNWYHFDTLVEVSCVAIEKFHKFQRLIQERALKNPILCKKTHSRTQFLSKKTSWALLFLLKYMETMVEESEKDLVLMGMIKIGVWVWKPRKRRT